MLSRSQSPCWLKPTPWGIKASDGTEAFPGPHRLSEKEPVSLYPCQALAFVI